MVLDYLDGATGMDITFKREAGSSPVQIAIWKRYAYLGTNMRNFLLTWYDRLTADLAETIWKMHANLDVINFLLTSVHQEADCINLGSDH